MSQKFHKSLAPGLPGLLYLLAADRVTVCNICRRVEFRIYQIGEESFIRCFRVCNLQNLRFRITGYFRHSGRRHEEPLSEILDTALVIIAVTCQRICYSACIVCRTEFGKREIGFCVSCPSNVGVFRNPVSCRTRVVGTLRVAYTSPKVGESVIVACEPRVCPSTVYGGIGYKERHWICD